MHPPGAAWETVSHRRCVRTAANSLTRARSPLSALDRSLRVGRAASPLAHSLAEAGGWATPGGALQAAAAALQRVRWVTCRRRAASSEPSTGVDCFAGVSQRDVVGVSLASTPACPEHQSESMLSHRSGMSTMSRHTRRSGRGSVASQRSAGLASQRSASSSVLLGSTARSSAANTGRTHGRGRKVFPSHGTPHSCIHPPPNARLDAVAVLVGFLQTTTRTWCCKR